MIMKTIQSYNFSIVLVLFLSISVLASCLTMNTKNITTDQSALLALKAHITSELDQTLAKNWSVAFPVCEWIGVTCGSKHTRVTALDISYMGLTGTIPPELGNLSFLVSLDMSLNNFHGELPHDLVRLRRLKLLNLDMNKISGEIPSWLGSLQQLKHLSLSDNTLVGSIPPSIFNLSNLEQLWLSNNSLGGTIPMDISNLRNLKGLIVENNQFSGSVPSVIFNISSLEVIDLARNILSGDLPTNICGRLPNLILLDISNNKFSGQILSTKTFSHCAKLQGLYLYSNDFSAGSIPKEIANLPMLEELNLADLNLEGTIPKEFGNFSKLTGLDLSKNKLTGEIPKEIGNLHRLEILYFNNNSLMGSIPMEIFNMSSLVKVGFGYNYLYGMLPSDLGYKLSNLEVLQLGHNDFSGIIPSSISNISELDTLSLSSNGFTGSIPNSLGNLRNLKFLNLATNNLSNEPSNPELSFITSLTSCRFLRYLILNHNPLNGFLPASLYNLSSALEVVSAAECKIKGRIPNAIGNLSSLLSLELSYNDLIGSVPRTIQGLQHLQELLLSFNKIRGPLDIFCRIDSLGTLKLEYTQISGMIPECIGNMTSLAQIYLNSNRLTSKIPAGLWLMKDLQELNLSSNSLNGSLPSEIGNLKAAVFIDLSTNQLSDVIPAAIGELQNLVNLSLANNRLQGSISESMGKMLSLQLLNLSHNNFSGLLPKSLESLQFLMHLDVSFNRLSGEIPLGGHFRNFTSQSFMFNEALCGDPRFDVPPCHGNSVKRSMKRYVLPLVVCISGIAAIVLSMAVVYGVLRHQKTREVPTGTDIMAMVSYTRFSYYDLLKSTDGYSESNLLGTGRFGSVYKGILENGTSLAVKVFNQLEGAFVSFDKECEVLGNLRHRNLTKVIGSCSNLEFKALVLQYMSNGSLEKWLYSHNYFLDLVQRLSIMIDVACALEYLHYGYTKPVVHCDLKPSNILLDDDMVAHVCDFGVAKMLGEGESDLHTKTLATMGYIAPEYGLEGVVSTRTDAYSFGIVLMETFSRMKPSDEMFSGDLCLKNWIEDSLTNATLDVIDANLVRPDDEHFSNKLECVSLIFKLALNCCHKLPRERTNMKDVATELKKIKHQLLKKEISRSRP